MVYAAECHQPFTQEWGYFHKNLKPIQTKERPCVKISRKCWESIILFSVSSPNIYMNYILQMNSAFKHHPDDYLAILETVV
jgi:hypothetical protein